MLDVKCGNGAFMSDLAKARDLATSLVQVAKGAGLPTTALLTDMNAPLASAAGNAVEVANAIDFLTGRHIDNRLWDVTVALGAEMLVSGGLAKDSEEGMARMSEAFQGGRAAEIFGRMVVALGGPADLMEAHEKHLPAAPIVREIAPPEGATVTAIDTRAIGIAVVALGGGRTRAADPVDPRVGFTDLAMIGDTGASLATIHAANEESAAEAEAALRAAYTFGEMDDIVEGDTVIERIA